MSVQRTAGGAQLAQHLSAITTDGLGHYPNSTREQLPESDVALGVDDDHGRHLVGRRTVEHLLEVELGGGRRHPADECVDTHLGDQLLDQSLGQRAVVDNEHVRNVHHDGEPPLNR